jgi:hypothetical protein
MSLHNQKFVARCSKCYELSDEHHRRPARSVRVVARSNYAVRVRCFFCGTESIRTSRAARFAEDWDGYKMPDKKLFAFRVDDYAVYRMTAGYWLYIYQPLVDQTV